MWNFLLQAEMMVPAIALDSCEVIILSQGPSLGESRACAHRNMHQGGGTQTQGGPFTVTFLIKKYANMGSNIFNHHRYGKRDA
jgi:hypothetical protein